MIQVVDNKEFADVMEKARRHMIKTFEICDKKNEKIICLAHKTSKLDANFNLIIL